MLLVLAFTDVAKAVNLLNRIKPFDNYRDHRFLAVYPDHLDPLPVLDEITRLTQAAAETLPSSDAFLVDPRIHPESRLMFAIAAHVGEVMKHTGAWFRLHPDAQPLSFGWVSRLEEEVNLTGKLGLVCVRADGIPSTASVLPGQLHGISPACRTMLRPQPWTDFMQHELLHQTAFYRTKLIVDLFQNTEPISARRTDARYIVTVGADELASQTVVAVNGGAPMLDAVAQAHAAWASGRKDAPEAPGASPSPGLAHQLKNATPPELPKPKVPVRPAQAKPLSASEQAAQLAEFSA